MPSVGPYPGYRVGDLAHDFTLKDLDDRKHSLKDLRGKEVVQVVFWATWCVPCLQEVPTLKKLQEKYHDRGLQILGIGVDLNQTPAILKAVAHDQQLNYPVLFDAGGAVQDRYRVSYIPQNFLIGKDGVIRFSGNDLPDDIETRIASLLKEAVPPPSAH